MRHSTCSRCVGPLLRSRLRYPDIQLQQARHVSGPGTTPPPTKRRAVTPFNDDGHVPWSELSRPEKAARSTQQFFNYGLAAAGLFMTLGVGYLMWADVFSPESKTNQFNRAVRRIKKDQRCLDALGPARKLVAHGDSAWSSLRRPRERPVAYVVGSLLPGSFWA